VSLYPEPNFADATRANHTSSPAHLRRRAQFDGRVDFTLSTRDRMFVRGSWMSFRGERRGSFPGPGAGSGNNDFARDHNHAFNVALSETHVFGASVVHEVRLGVNSLRTNKRPLVSGFPNQDFGLRVEAAEPIEGLARLADIAVLDTPESTTRVVTRGEFRPIDFSRRTDDRPRCGGGRHPFASFRGRCGRLLFALPVSGGAPTQITTFTAGTFSSYEWTHTAAWS
jgi:hypothetical protein